MGFHEMLIKLGIAYNSEQAVETAKEVMYFIRMNAIKESHSLALERGVFGAYEGSYWEKQGLPMRNATVTTIAPTGSISLICNTTGGIEPIFAVTMTRNHDVIEDTLIEVNSLFEQYAKQLGFYSEELMRKIALTGHLEGIDEVPVPIQQLFATSHNITPEWHIKIQAAFQEYTCNAVSKTINMPYDATVEDVLDAYMLAYELGCKGLTVYRDGSRDKQVLNRGIKAEDSRYTCPACGNVFHVYEGSCSFCPQCGTKECN